MTKTVIMPVKFASRIIHEGSALAKIAKSGRKSRTPKDFISFDLYILKTSREGVERWLKLLGQL